MRDEPALRIHHVGLSALTNFDLRYDVPNQLEVDFSHTDASVAPRTGKGQGHVRLRLAPEIDRAVVDLVRHCFEEFRLLGEIGLTADHIHGQTRDAQLLATAGVELRELCDRGYLTQEAQPVETALVDGSRRPRQLRRPPHLTFDLLDQLSDLCGGGFRLLALNANERGLVFLIREPEL